MSHRPIDSPNQKQSRPSEDEASQATVLAENAVAIRKLTARLIDDAIEIGRRLSDCKKRLGHGNWLPWLEREFGWSERTARNCIGAYELTQSESANFADLRMTISSLYLLAAPSTPEKARVEVLRQAEARGGLPHAEVKRLVAEAKGHLVGDRSVKRGISTGEVIEKLGYGRFAKLPDVERAKIMELPWELREHAIEEAAIRQGWKLPYRQLIDALDALDALNPSDATEKSSIKKVADAFPLDDDFVTPARIERAIEFLVKLAVKLGPAKNDSQISLASDATILDKLLAQAREDNSKNTDRPIRRRSVKPSDRN
jgi:hypothetical protein